MNKSQIATGGMFNPSKSQFRGPDGTGRDPYIYNNNGGFCPPKQPHKIEELGKSPPDLVTPPSNWNLTVMPGSFQLGDEACNYSKELLKSLELACLLLNRAGLGVYLTFTLI